MVSVGCGTSAVVSVLCEAVSHLSEKMSLEICNHTFYVPGDFECASLI